jgi:hypothetical protein
VKVATTGRSFKMTLTTGQQIELYHCDAAAMANTIPRAYYCKEERGVECCLCFIVCVCTVFFYNLLWKILKNFFQNLPQKIFF